MKKILLLIISAVLAITPAFAALADKYFSDYVDITPTRNSRPETLRVHYFAKQRENDRPHDPLYKNNQWKIVMRWGIYLAQKDKAMSEMYRYFLGYSTDVDIVEDHGDFYIARRKFKSFKKAYNPDRKERDYVRKDGNNFLVGKYLLLDDGRLVRDGEVKQFKGLASIAVLTDFFGEADYGDYNYGYQISDTEVKAIFYDCEHALNFHDNDDGESYSNLEGDLIHMLGKEFVNMTWYQREKKQMLQKIADTDFSVIETILRKNITGSRLDEERWKLNKILSDPKVMPQVDRVEARKQLDEINKLNDKDHGIEQVIRTLRVRHEKLRLKMLKIRIA